MFEGQVDTQIIKGKKPFEHPVSMDICKICARLCQDRIKEKVRNHYFTELFFSEYHGQSFSFEIQNVRAECRESRDLMQDLEDIRNGIQIVHASDMEKRDSENKRERRRQSRESAVRRLEKKLLENGYESLEEYSTAEIVFEEQDFDGFLCRLEEYPDMEYLGEVIEHSWGQRVIRFYDLDGHIIEVGEDMKMVIKRFLASGMTMDEISVKMDASVEDLTKLLDSECMVDE